MIPKQFVESKIIDYSPLISLNLNMHYSEVDAFNVLNTNNPHFHEEAEIYFNLSGDVCFMVEENIYRIKRGSILITRPNEYHHCIYQSNALHCHYWILLPVNNQIRPFLSRFFNRKKGTNNLIQLTSNDTERFDTTCKKLIYEQLSVIEQYELLFKLLRLIDSGECVENINGSAIIPNEMRLALEYIEENLSSPLKVTDIANSLFVSVNTIERQFNTVLGISPTQFIKDKRLIRAEDLLKQGNSVQEACFNSGFVDCSRFISDFKKRFGMTPLKYKKSLNTDY